MTVVPVTRFSLLPAGARIGDLIGACYQSHVNGWDTGERAILDPELALCC
jgi:hypothetical protein